MNLKQHIHNKILDDKIKAAKEHNDKISEYNKTVSFVQMDLSLPKIVIGIRYVDST
jgi:hypothetical protein